MSALLVMVASCTMQVFDGRLGSSNFTFRENYEGCPKGTSVYSTLRPITTVHIVAGVTVHDVSCKEFTFGMEG